MYKNPVSTQLFRPCIDIHKGQVKQIVGASLHTPKTSKTLKENSANKLTEFNKTNIKENFISKEPLSYYVEIYKKFGLSDGHIIMLDQSVETKKVAKEALALDRGEYHLGGGVNIANAQSWIDAGAKKVIVSSAIFTGKEFKLNKLKELSSQIGKRNLVVDLSAVSLSDGYYASIHGWKTITDFMINKYNLELTGKYAGEFLVHAIDREGKKGGADFTLIEFLYKNSPIPVVYAGGIASITEVKQLLQATDNKMGFTIGSSLDIFGGNISLQTVLEVLKTFKK